MKFKKNFVINTKILSQVNYIASSIDMDDETIKVLKNKIVSLHTPNLPCPQIGTMHAPHPTRTQLGRLAHPSLSMPTASPLCIYYTL